LASSALVLRTAQYVPAQFKALLSRLW